MPRYVHVQTGEMREGHPLAHLLRPWMTRRRAALRHPRVTDSWVVFGQAPPAGGGPGGLYCFDFRTGVTSDELLPEAVRAMLTPSVLPAAVLEPSAQRIAESAAVCWPKLAGDELLAAAKRDLWERSAAAARSMQLAVRPCPLGDVVQMALFLGIEPTTHPHLMWLAHAALAPEVLLAGWAVATDEHGEAYYWSRSCGFVQWEHPTVAFLHGVAARLVGAKCKAASK
jgi:hypothetical protein